MGMRTAGLLVPIVMADRLLIAERRRITTPWGTNVRIARAAR